MWIIEVDGVKYRLLRFTQVWMKETRSNVSDIKVGDKKMAIRN
ncbi:hypothetical protein QFZ77_004447 [Paenibacillus sp. V4I3]|nr:hypothetical protein [Paenibacillus sp. V4I3]MDQ0875788.1 hypothetical protein [Paenibacillus sp. V4I3]